MMGKKNFFEADHLPARGEFKDEKIWGYFMFGQPILEINDEWCFHLWKVEAHDAFPRSMCRQYGRVSRQS